MPRSPVQFQKGQSLAEFTDRYGSEEQCRAPSSRHAGRKASSVPNAGANAAAGCAAAMSSNAPVAGIRSR